MKLSVIILNWNGKDLLEKFLPYIVKYSFGFDIYLVDNNSNDDSIEFTREKFPIITIIELNKNYGYAEGYNIAVKKVDSEIYCFLNSDVRVTENWLNPIIDIFKNNQSISIIQPKILDEKKPKKFEYSGAAGGFIDQLGYPYCRGRIFNTIEKDNKQYSDREIFWASGACFFVRSNTFKTLGGFDKRFFAYMEEIDFCWRAYNKGEKTYYTESSTVYHLGSQSLKTKPLKTYFNFRNNLLTITKNTPHSLFIVIIFRLFLDGLAGFNFLLKGKFLHTLAIISSHFSYYFMLRKALIFRSKNKPRLSYPGEYSIILKYFVLRKKSFLKFKEHNS